MPRLLPSMPLPRAIARARTVLAASALVLLLTMSVFAAHLLVDAPSKQGPYSHHRYVQKGDDWFAYTDVPGGTGDRVAALWSTDKEVDRMFMTRLGEIDRLLAGGSAPILQEWRPGGPDWQRTGPGVWNHGVLHFETPDSCSGLQKGCTTADRPVLVWLRGDDWKGTPEDSLAVGANDLQDNGAVPSRGPLSYFRYSVMDEPLYVLTPVYLGVAALSILAGVASAVAWWRLARRAPPEEAGAAPLLEVGASEMLRLARLAELYVVTISRYFLLSGVFIVLATGVVMYLALPPMLDVALAHYRGFGEYPDLTALVFAVTPLYVAAVALGFWFAQLREARRELARWRRFRQGLDEQAAAILAA